MQNLPLFFDMSRARLLLVGNGKGAMQRLRLLGATQAEVILIAPRGREDLLALAKSYDNVEVLQREFRSEDLSLVKFLFLAPETLIEREVAVDIAYRARFEGIAVNAIDDKSLCDFYVPALVDRGPVVVAIGTEGTAPVLARRLKSQIERLLPVNLGALSNYAGELRERVRKSILPMNRRYFWQSFFELPLADKVSRGVSAVDSLHAPVQALLCSMGGNFSHSRLDVVALLSQDIISSEVRDALFSADVVVYDSSIDVGILNLARRDADFVSVDSGSFAPRIAVERASKGLRVIRLLSSCAGGRAEFFRYRRILSNICEVSFYSCIGGLVNERKERAA